jgi:hypothetical protein
VFVRETGRRDGRDGRRTDSDTEVAVARQPSGTGSAEESSDAPLEELEADAEALDEDDPVDDEPDEDDNATPAGRSAATDALWTDVRVQPVEIALRSGVGYTLRAYRPSTEVRDPDTSNREDDFPTPRSAAERTADDEDAEEPVEIDEAELTAQALAAGRGDDDDGERADDDIDDEDTDRDDEDAAGADEEEADEEEAEAEEAAEPEDIPVFLAEDGKLLLFRSPEGLVEYVRGSGADHELAQLDTWDELRERIEPEDIVPLDEDRYELDLVVENLRGGHDVWDPTLIIQAGEVARDVAYALRVNAVMTALAPGSPLDDLDEGLRTVEAGGFSSFFARRKLRKIDAQTTAALGWRTIVGKISAVVDWRN